MSDEVTQDIGDVNAEVLAGEQETEGTPETFSREYVEGLRRENAKYRDRARTYEEVYGDYTDDDQQVWFNMARLFQSDPKQGAAYMESLAKEINQEYGAEAEAEFRAGAKEVQESAPLPEGVLTVETYKQMRAEEKAQEDGAKAIADVESEAQTLGYDLNSQSYIDLLWTATNQTDGDLQKAHEAVQAHNQGIIDAYLAEKGAPGYTPPSGGGQGPSHATEIKTFEQAKASTMQRLKNAGWE